MGIAAARSRHAGRKTARLPAADQPDTVIIGSSTGTNCFYGAAQTCDRALNEEPSGIYRWVPGLGVLPTYVASHISEFQRRDGIPRAWTFQQAFLTPGDEANHTGAVGIGIPAQLALRIRGGLVHVTGTDRYAQVLRVERTAAGAIRDTFKQGKTIAYGDFFLSTTLTA